VRFKVGPREAAVVGGEAVGIAVPAEVERLMTAQVAAEIAGVFGDGVVYPERVVVDALESNWHGSGRRFPGWPGEVLVLSDECQSVCSWGVPLGTGSCEVLVGGDLLDAGDATVRYTASVADFIAVRRWDRECLSGGPLLQAQAPEQQDPSLAQLEALLSPAPSTAGWPGSRQYRFDGDGKRVMLWTHAGQCDWWISAASEPQLKALTAALIDLPGLRGYLWATSDASERVLTGLTV
jgi:hypothetical protein